MMRELPDDTWVQEWEEELRFLSDTDPKVQIFRKYLAAHYAEREKLQRQITTDRIRRELAEIRENLPEDANNRDISDAM